MKSKLILIFTLDLFNICGDFLSNEFQHISQAQHNELFLSSIEKTPDYLDWKFIVLFYSALHYGDAFLAKKYRKHCKTHTDRKNTYSQINRKDLFLAYKNLEDFSRTARYYPEGISALTETDFQDAYNNDFLLFRGLC